MTRTSSCDGEDLTRTHILGSLKPMGPEPARMSIPPSLPGSDLAVTYPSAFKIDSTILE
jgi:hypothetical protein